MEQYIFCSLLNLVGPEFLSYILNYQKGISYRSKLNYLDLTEDQIDVLRSLLKLIDECDEEIGTDPEASFIFHLFNSKDPSGQNLFNQFRKRCGGKKIIIKENDPVMEYILNKAVHYYPSLLLKEDFSATRVLGDKSTSFDHDKKELDDLMELIKKDEVLTKFFTVDKDENLWFNYTFNNNLPVSMQGYLFLPVLLTRAFHNCCYRDAYTMEDFLQEVRENVQKLRAIGRGEEITWSIFCGLQGLGIEDQKGFYLSDECFLKEIGKGHTILKSLYSTVGNAHMGADTDGIATGSILEIKFPNKNNKSALINPLTAAREFVPSIVDHLNQALAFSKRKNYTPVAKTFFDIDLPVIAICPYWDEKKFSETMVVESRDMAELKDWFLLLQNSKAHLLRISLQRIKYAIAERDRLEDAVLDGLIGWEGMFSKDGDCSNAVSQSIEHYYSKVSGTQLREGRTKELYELRNIIIHGKLDQDVVLQGASLSSNREEIVHIALECLKGILKDKKLLELNSEERVRELL
jgi:hypothetical protein